MNQVCTDDAGFSSRPSPGRRLPFPRSPFIRLSGVSASTPCSQTTPPFCFSIRNLEPDVNVVAVVGQREGRAPESEQ